jgi:hypothetical protein
MTVEKAAVTDPVPVDQEFVVHVFAPVEGPYASRAHDQLAAIWAACRHRLGMSEPILGTGLPTELPAGWHEPAPSSPLAALEHAGADYQAILRREHDILNLSVVFAPPQDATAPGSGRRLRIGSAAPPGWVEFDRWWEDLAAQGTEALLGITRIYQAKVTDPSVAAIRTVQRSLPRLDQDDGWQDRPLVLTQGITAWEPTSRDDTRTERRLIILAPTDRDPQLSALTWSRGDTNLPPLARYLMHAAKLRYELRVWAGGRHVRQVRQRLADQVEQLRTWIGGSVQHPPADEDLASLATDVAAVDRVVSRTRELRQTVHTASRNMARAVGEFVADPTGPDLVTDDQDLAQWFLETVDNAIADLDNVDRSAHSVIELSRLHLPDPPPDPPRTRKEIGHGPPRSPGRPKDRTEIRMGFSVDVVDYSSRSQRGKSDAQHRVADIIGQALRDIGLHISDTDHQGTGDGLNAFLPANVEIDRALPQLVRSTVVRLAQDNQRYHDRLRLRMAAAVGPVRPAALGYADNTIIEFCRLVDSPPLRQAMNDHPGADLAVLVSDVLHRFTVRDGESGLDPTDLTPIQVTVKTFQDTAWLWVPQSTAKEPG